MSTFSVTGLPQERVVPWVNALMVVLFAVVLARATWQLAPAPGLPGMAAQAVAPTTPAGGPGEKSPGLAEVARLHLFGTPPSGQAPRVAAIEAPETRLNLILRGVFAAGDPQQGAAIIADGSGNEAFYGIGDRLPGGAILQEVYPERVILGRGGRFETLRLPEESRNGVSVTEQSAADQLSTVPELGRYRELIRNEPGRAFDLVRVAPVTENGRLAGYRISPGKERELFRRAGLRAGDVVKSVNGIDLSDPGRMNELFGQLTAAGRLDLVVERSGAVRNIAVSLE